MKENVIRYRKGPFNKTGLIGKRKTFFQDEDFNYTLNNNQYFINEYIGSDTDVSILDIRRPMYKVLTNRKKSFLRATDGVSIDTGYIWTTNNVKMEICFKNLEKRYATIFGAEDTQNLTESGKYSLIGHTLSTSDLRFGWYVGKKPSLGSSTALSFTDKIHTMSIETNESTSQIICTVDDNTQTYTNSNAVIVNKTLTNSVFSSHFQTYYGQFAPCDVYYCKMWDNGVMVRNLYPIEAGTTINGYTCPSNGLYDYINGTFYPNVTGNGTLTYFDE